MIGLEDLGLIDHCHDVKEAAAVVASYYENYHSARYVADRLLLRVKRPIAKTRLALLNKKFKDLLAKGKIEQYMQPFEEEHDEPHTHDLLRIALYYDRHHSAKLHQLIKALNKD